MSTYFYVIAVTPCKIKSTYHKAGEIIARHATQTDATLRLGRITRSIRDTDHRNALWTVCTSESLKIGAVSEALREAAVIDRRRHDCIEAMIEVLAQEGGNAGKHSETVIADVLFRYQLTLDDLREEFTGAAKESLSSRDLQRQSVAEHNARMTAVKNEVQRDLNAITYSFPAVRGIQAGREYFAAQIPYAIVAKLFVFDDEIVPPEHRAQRLLNERRASAIADYMTANPTDYVLPALTCSVSAEMTFEPIGGSHQVGMLHVPMGATILINDGQHRRHAIGAALKRSPGFAAETISVSIYYDQGLRRAQQMFADINSKQVRPSSAISALYDQRNPFNTWVLELLQQLPAIHNRIDYENATVGAKSAKLWSLIGFKKFVSLLTGLNEGNFDQAKPDRLQALQLTIAEFFAQIKLHVPDWAAMVDGKIAPADVRAQLIIGHTVWLHGLAVMGNEVLRRHQAVRGLERLSLVSSSRTSPMWEGRCVIHGKMQMTSDGIKSTAAKLLTLINLPLPQGFVGLERQASLLESTGA